VGYSAGWSLIRRRLWSSLDLLRQFLDVCLKLVNVLILLLDCLLVFAKLILEAANIIDSCDALLVSMR
jgi:hypothetical protein